MRTGYMHEPVQTSAHKINRRFVKRQIVWVPSSNTFSLDSLVWKIRSYRMTIGSAAQHNRLHSRHLLPEYPAGQIQVMSPFGSSLHKPPFWHLLLRKHLVAMGKEEQLKTLWTMRVSQYYIPSSQRLPLVPSGQMHREFSSPMAIQVPPFWQGSS